MAAPTAYVILNAGAVSQQDRDNAAPAPEQVAVDGRSLAQLLAFPARYGELINFYSLEDKPEGDWAGFFAGDPAIAHALHASLNLPAIEKLFAELLASLREDDNHRRRAGSLGQALETVDALVRVLDRAHLIQGGGAKAGRGLDPNERRDSLAAPLGRLHGHLSGDALRTELTQAQHGGRSAWGATLADILEDVVTALLDELKQGLADAGAALQVSLGSGGHAPQAAVYNAFVQLFMEARKALNRFPRRLVDFYYEDVLAQSGLAAEPDQLFLGFTLAKPDVPASVPRGALFSAGVDAANQPINYAASTSLEVTPAVVEGLSIHRVTFAPANGGGTTLPSGVLSGDIPVNLDDQATTDAFPLFGSASAAPPGALDLKPASLGFTVATPVLMARGGRRIIGIGLVIAPKTSAQAYQFLMAHGASQGPGALDAAVAGVIHESLELHYSTAGGWVTVDSYSVTPSPAPGRPDATVFTFVFNLPDDAPPIEPLSAKPDPNAPPPDLPASTFPDSSDKPAVIASLKTAPDGATAPKPAIDPFPVLSGLVIEELIVDLTVDGLSDLTVSTSNGPVDTSQTFAVLGLPPVQYGGFEVYAPELFAKALTELSVSITWSGLPVSSAGFEGYYKGYQLDADGAVSPTPLFDNTSFNVAFSVKNPGLWDVNDAPAPLFNSATPAADGSLAPAPAAPVLRTSTLCAEIIPGDVEPPAYYNPAASALQVALVSPDYAFGATLFTPNMLAAAAQQTAAALAAAQPSAGSGAAQIAHLAAANATAPEKGYAAAVTPVVEQSISALTGDALAAVKLAISLSGAPVASQAALLADLDTALSLAPEAASLWKRLTGSAVDPVAVLNGLEAWLKLQEPLFGKAAQAALARAHAALDAGKTIATTSAAAVNQPAAVAKLNMAAAAQQARAATAPPPMPNPPWTPVASAISVSYTATTRGSAQALQTIALTQVAQGPTTPSKPDLSPAFAHIGAFGNTRAAPASDSGFKGLVPPVGPDAAFYIQLSAQTPQISLLFVLTAGANGWWEEQPTLCWQQRIDGEWESAALLGDSTNSLANSGVVTLGLATGDKVRPKPRLRVLSLGDTEKAPLVQAVIANALTASWVGPGGSGSLGDPLPASTISKSVAPIAGIGSIVQPMESFGGRPALNGAEFQMWMAERLRHKGFGIDAWDYARLVLEAAPVVWQAIVVPAVDQQTGASAPGRVWVVAVAGHKAPNISDPTAPALDFTTLSTIGEQLEASISPFVQLAVTNPPYLRMKVTATCIFSADDTPDFWKAKLQDELVRWLSPWPPVGLGRRPADYYTQRAVAEFVRGRPYVAGVTSLVLAPEDPPPTPNAGYFYRTSSKTHDLTGVMAPPASDGGQAWLVVEAST